MVRFKHRYFLLKIVFNDNQRAHNVESYKIYNKLKNVVETIHGEYGIACTDVTLSVKYVNVYTNIALLRVRRKFHHIIRSALPFVTCIEQTTSCKTFVPTPCFLQTLYVGGTIRSCQKFLIKYHRKQLNRIIHHCSTPGEKRKIRKVILACSLENNPEGQDSDVSSGEEVIPETPK